MCLLHALLGKSATDVYLFSHSGVFLCIFLMAYFDELKFLKFWNPIYHCFKIFIFCILCKKSLPNPRLLKKCIYVFLIKASLYFTFRTMIHRLVFVGKYGQKFIFFPTVPVSLIKRVYFQQRINLAPLSKNQLTIYGWLCFCALICLSVLKQYHTALITKALYELLKLVWVSYPTFFLISKLFWLF